MGYIDVAIPASIGLLALLWPQALFYGSRTAPEERTIRLVRGGGIVLLVVAAMYLAVKLAGA